AGLRNDMRAMGMTRAANVYEPGDHIASPMEGMGGLSSGRFGDPAPFDKQITFFNYHIGPWAEHFFTDLEGSQNSVFYASVGATGSAFMQIEKEAFQMSAG
ncbi:MAG: molecular chaperone TorD, partial [Rhodobacteraceae bacterium]|nr:molecular chaperone TorD [Paracoccaceae bacterium]